MLYIANGIREVFTVEDLAGYVTKSTKKSLQSFFFILCLSEPTVWSNTL